MSFRYAEFVSDLSVARNITKIQNDWYEKRKKE